ncbi:hypothetical protein SAZ10_17695 [Mesorhizobium sp. BAC0120]|uniref:hypothetical protein n=1 Tax=Mesorhizobium sp. BAC0120 TaxID=3090670 RepID=UPI00298CBC3F|nr:hypothetical protein [Mesorhizobium sp. BAC0120]MDW6023587.1 hypothetical protein [Mesorhizobium sp. BAC0120]
MSAKRKQDATDKAEDRTEQQQGPTLAQEDWDAVKGADPAPTGVPDDDLRQEPINAPEPGDLPEEDDDNPYQESDEALPDDEEEAALTRDPSKQKSRFDEV